MLASHFGTHATFRGFDQEIIDEILADGYPDLLVASGRATASLSYAIRRASGGNTCTVQIQHPRSPDWCYDYIVTPRHDYMEASSILSSIFPSQPSSNVLTTFGSLHNVCSTSLSDAGALWAPRLVQLQQPRLLLLVGGDCKAYNLSVDRATLLAKRVMELSESWGGSDAKGSVMISFSRRTPDPVAEYIRQAFESGPLASSTYIWPEREGATPAVEVYGSVISSDNPYMGFLALADAIVVTADSINMVSEAIGVHKPTIVFDAAHTTGKIRKFHRVLHDGGMVDALDENTDLAALALKLEYQHSRGALDESHNEPSEHPGGLLVDDLNDVTAKLVHELKQRWQ
jgi:mitochondrial fission protein ELM1